MELMIQIQTFSIFWRKEGIKPGIKVRKNSVVSPKNNSLRNEEVILQTKEDLLKWKKKRKYGHRWIDETAFLTFKSILASVCIRNKVSK